MLPNFCSACGKIYDGIYALCHDCMNEMNRYSYGEKCEKCGRTLKNPNDEICEYCRKVKPAFDRAAAVFPYKDRFKEAIKKVKFKNEYYIFRGMSRLMEDNVAAMNVKPDCIVYIPSDIKAFFQRDYCLTQELASHLSKKMKIPVYYGFFLKKLKVQRQSTVEFEKRYKNIKNAFMKNPFCRKSVAGKTVLLIDDVITTGSTLSECASVLKRNGAAAVYAAALTYGASK